MKPALLPLALGVSAPVVGGLLALVCSAALGAGLGAMLGLGLAAIGGGLAGLFVSRTLEGKVGERLAAAVSSGPAVTTTTGWSTIDARLADLDQSFTRLERARVDLDTVARSLAAKLPDLAPGAGAGPALDAFLAESSHAAAVVLGTAEGLGRAIGRLTSGATAQAEAIAKTTVTVETFYDQIERISRNAEEASTASEQARDEARQGLEQVHGAVAGMDRLRAHVEANGRKMRRLGDRSVEIGTIVDLINGISQRTDMLALNATIESVRAGEHGRGFAVVAEEIHKLAERVAEATRDIGELVRAIQDDTQASVVALSEEQAEVTAEADRVREAGAALERISRHAERTAELVEGISHSTQGQVHATQDLVRHAQQISEVTQRTLDGAAEARTLIEALSSRCQWLQSLAPSEGAGPRLAAEDGNGTTAALRRRLTAAGRNL